MSWVTNMIKGLMLYLRYHEQELICISFMHWLMWKKNQIKEKLIVECQAYCEEKQKTSIHEILSNGLYSWLGTFKVQIVESIIARLHGLIKINIHLWARYIGLIYGSLQCVKYGYHSWLQCKTKKWRYENGIWNSLLVCKA